MEKLIKEKVFSTVEDKNIKDNLDNSLIWTKAKHLEDVEKGDKGFLYTILFDGPKPVGVTSIKSFSK